MTCLSTNETNELRSCIQVTLGDKIINTLLYNYTQYYIENIFSKIYMYKAILLIAFSETCANFKVHNMIILFMKKMIIFLYFVCLYV